MVNFIPQGLRNLVGNVTFHAFFGKGKAGESSEREETLAEAFGYVPGREAGKTSFPFDVKGLHSNNLKDAELGARSQPRDEHRLYEEAAQNRTVQFPSYSSDDLILRTYRGNGLSTVTDLQRKAYDDVKKISWGMLGGNSGANNPWAFPNLVGDGNFRVAEDLSLEEKKAVLKERHKHFIPLIIQWMPNTTVPGHDFTYEELAVPTRINSAHRRSESDGFPSRSARNLRVHFASPELLSSSAPRSGHIPEEGGAVADSVSVALSSEGSSIFDRSSSGDEEEYESDGYSDPPASIMTEQPENPRPSSVKKGKRPVRAATARSRSFVVGTSHPKSARRISEKPRHAREKNSLVEQTGTSAPCTLESSTTNLSA